MEVTVPHPERKFLGGTGSLKSVEQNDFTSTSPPSSLSRVTSLKSKKPQLRMSILYLGRTPSSYFKSGGMKNKDVNTQPSPTPLPNANHKTEEMSNKQPLYEGVENNARSQTRLETTQRNRLNRSKTISQLFTSRFLTRSPATRPYEPPQALSRSPTHIASAFGSKETRDAALRERGLLPPSKPNVDLSLAERERDRHLPVLTPPQEEEPFVVDEQGTEISPAARVKEEWEAKYKDAREPKQKKSLGGLRLTSFPLPASLQASIEQPSICCGAPSLSSDTITSAPLKENSQLLAPLPLSNNSDDHAAADNPLETQHSIPSSEPYLIPLPPSPTPSSFLRFQENPAVISLTASFPLPPSSGLSAPSLNTSLSITPPIINASAPAHQCPTGSGSFFNATSPERPVSTVVTPVSTNSLDNDKTDLVESPVEITPLTGLKTISDCPHDHGDFEVAVRSDISTARSSDLRKAKTRNFTDPTGLKIHEAKIRKSSFYNPFKSSADSPPSTLPQRRLSIGTSLNNVRRSLIGSFSRPKTAGTRKRFDGSYLPPTLSATCADQGAVSPTLSPTFLQHQRNLAPPELKPRVPVSPTLYSWRTIVSETNNIEDEESRRMTELAFLG